jgi:SAM-dependent methyltransferase
MAVPEYKEKLYKSYVSEFTRSGGSRPSYAFSDSKLVPLLVPWLRSLDRAAPCLDLGCGDGNILHALRALGFQSVEGVDVSEEQVALARKNCSRVVCADIFAYLRAAERNHYALITLFDVIEHLEKSKILSLLEEIQGVLRPGGVFIAHCPNGNSPFAFAVFASDFTHETLLNEASARHICTVCNLVNFSAVEHLGASRSLSGKVLQVAWWLVRIVIRATNLIETGSSGSPILTRNFAFKAEKPRDGVRGYSA